MLKPLAVVLLALELGAGFGAASAELFSTSTNAMEIELRVEVRQSAETVVAHLAFDGNDPITLPMVQRESGVFGIRTEVSRINYRVVFEIVGAESVRSAPHTLAELGLTLPSDAVSTTSSTPESGGLSDNTSGWGWMALGLAAAALSALAFWVLGGEEPGDQVSSESSSMAGSDESPAI